MAFKVACVIDGVTFAVKPDWKFRNVSGDIVQAEGYGTPERGQRGYHAAKDKLTELILGKFVELKDPIKVTYGRLLCDVYLKGKNIATRSFSGPVFLRVKEAFTSIAE